MKFVVVIILLIVGFTFFNKGIDILQSSTAAVTILGLEINTNSKGGQAVGVVCLVLGITALLGSYFLKKKSKNSMYLITITE